MARAGLMSRRISHPTARAEHKRHIEARVAHVLLWARSAPEGVCRQGEEQNGHGRDVHGVVGGGDVPVEVALYLLLRDAERRALGHVLVEMAAAHDGRGAQQRGGSMQLTAPHGARRRRWCQGWEAGAHVRKTR